MLTKRASKHDSDFFGWTQEQASLLRGMSDGDARLDIHNLAEEIEDMGRAEVNKIKSLLKQTIAHLLKLAIEPNSEASDGWYQEVITFQGDAVLAFSPDLKQKIEIEAIWEVACNSAVRSLERYSVPIPDFPRDCPLSLDDLLMKNFDPKAAIEALTCTLYPGNDREA